MASILSLYMQHDDLHFIPNDKIPSALLLFNAPASYETERTLATLVQEQQQQGSSNNIRNIPSIHIWGGETDFAWNGQQELYKIHHPDGKVIRHEQGHFLPESSQPQVYTEIIQALHEIV